MAEYNIDDVMQFPVSHIIWVWQRGIINTQDRALGRVWHPVGRFRYKVVKSQPMSIYHLLTVREYG